ncbi:MAG: histidine phosphatase family protein [Alphaproteobacteria bacterium]
MKTLYLLRHAKSSWHDPALNDFDRPLNPRGLRNAPLIGSYMAEHGYLPEVILCSAARRTLETLSLIKPYVGLSTPTLVQDGLYLASARMLLSAVNEIDDSFSSALVIAHNPGLEDLCSFLSLKGPEARPAPETLPTAGLVVFRCTATAWEDLAEGTGRLLDVIMPRALDPTADD